MQTTPRLTEHSTGTRRAEIPVKLLCVPPDAVSEVWQHVSGMVESAMRRGDCGDYDTVKDAIHEARMLLWIVWDGSAIIASVVTEIGGINGRKICTIVACGGVRLERFISLISGIEKYAADEGCSAVRIIGRHGWRRVLRDYYIRGVQLEKGL